MNIIVLSLFVIIMGFFVTSVSGAPWVPARKYDLESLLNDAKVDKSTLYVELGCGDGRLVRAAAKRGATSIGYELNPFLWFIAWTMSMPYKNAHIKLANFWTADISQADVVMAFLVPRTMHRLDKKAAKEMKHNSKLVSYIFPLPQKKHTQKSSSWYVYTF